MLEVSKHSLFGVLSIIFALNVIIYITIEIISILILQTSIFFEGLFFLVAFLTITTTIFGLIARFVMKDDLGSSAILIGAIGFFLNLVVLFLFRLIYYID
jgi:uncharacterized membrane protein